MTRTATVGHTGNARLGRELLMAWARIDDAFDDHPKVLALLENEQGGAAVGLWTLCLTWAHRNTLRKGKTPGLLPASLPRRYLGPGARELAALLVKEELWEALAEGDGWLIHDFDKYLPTDKTREARSEAGKKGAASRWAKHAGRDSNLPSGDGKPVAADRPRDGGGQSGGQHRAPRTGKPQPDGNELFGDSNLPSGLPSTDGKAMASDGSRALARRAISNEIAPVPVPVVPPTAGGASAPPTTQTILAGFIDWDRANGGTLTKRTIGQIAKQVGDLLDQGIGDRFIRLGLAEWRASGQNPSTLDSFVNAAMKGSPGGSRASPRRPSTTDQRIAQGQAVKAALAARQGDTRGT